MNLVRALDMNPLEGLDERLQAKMLADTSDPNVTAPTEDELQIVEAHMKRRANETTRVILDILAEKPQSVHTWEQSTGLTPIMLASQTGNLEHLGILLAAMRSWRVKRELDEWKKEEDNAAAAAGARAGAATGGTEEPPSNATAAIALSSPPSPTLSAYKYAFKNPTINRHDESGYAPIHHIIYSGNARALAMVLGVPPSAGDGIDNASATTAAAADGVATVESAGNTTTTTSPSAAAGTPMTTQYDDPPACSSPHPNHQSANLMSVGCDVNLSTVYMPSMRPTGETPLHLAVRLAGVVEGSAAGNNGSTTATTVADADLSMVKLLLENGAMASLNNRDDRGRTPLGQLDAAKNAGDGIVIAFLESIGAKR